MTASSKSIHFAAPPPEPVWTSARYSPSSAITFLQWSRLVVAPIVVQGGDGVNCRERQKRVGTYKSPVQLRSWGGNLATANLHALVASESRGCGESPEIPWSESQMATTKQKQAAKSNIAKRR